MSEAGAKLQFVLDLQDKLGGSIPFERWMREALYHPQFGYYTANIRGIGRGGDFTTWPALHASLAQALAGWALRCRPGGRWHVIEIGAGAGDLAAALLRAIGWWNRPVYHIVEVSPRLRAVQQKRLGRRVRWQADMASALRACAGRALIISNELVDAFPCRIFRKQEEGWRELALRVEAGQVAEVWRDGPLPDSTAFAHPWPLGQRVEVQESFSLWQKEWLPDWKAGRMLTIDYGAVVPALYQRRSNGTLRAYAHQQRIEGPGAYLGFGLRDLTADVNFSDLVRWGERENLKTVSLASLGEFVAAWTEADDPVSQALNAPGGAGEAFLVLDQAR